MSSSLLGLSKLLPSALQNGTKNSFSSVSTAYFNRLKNANISSPVVLVSTANQIHFNIALETYLMNVVKPQVPVLFLWQNEKTVVIGRNQNPWKECDTAKMATDGVDLARRFSGGGAVYQDLGNSCFTFLVPEKVYNVNKNNSIIIDALKEEFGIDGAPSGRNDLCVGDRKFSGSAFKYIKSGTDEMRGLSLHHGTILTNTDFNALQNYLTPNKLKLQSKGLSSVVSRVINLKELNPNIEHSKMIQPLAKQFLAKYGSNNEGTSEIQYLDKKSEFTTDPGFDKILSHLVDWDWRYGKTPEFSHRLEKRFNWATMDLHLNVIEGEVKEVKLFSDCLFTDLIEAIELAIVGSKYTPNAISERLASLKQSPDIPSEWHQMIDDFGVWVGEEIAS